MNTHSAEHSDADKTDRTAALNGNSGVEAENAGGLCSLYCVDKNRTGLDEDSGVQIQIAYVEYGGAASYYDVVSEPAVVVNVIVWEKTVNICKCYDEVIKRYNDAIKSL